MRYQREGGNVMDNACTVSRRGLVAATAASAAALLTGAGASEPARADEVPFDEETDLLVVGSGSGIFCAIAAKHIGVDCIVLEKEPYMYGGSTFLSSGGQWVPGNVQSAELVAEEDKQFDDLETMKTFMDEIQYRGTQAYGEGMIEKMLVNAPTYYNYIVNDLGLPWGDFVWPLGDYQSVTGRGYCRIAGVNDMWVKTREFVDGLDLDLRMGVTATRLLTDEAGAVVGVEAADLDGNVLRYGAKHVIVAAGPFDRNSDMVNAFLRVPLEASVVGEGCTGDGIRMGMELGADLANMTHVIAAPFHLNSPDNAEGFFANNDQSDSAGPRMYPHMLMVNACGVRVANESSFYGAIGDAMMNNYATGGKQYSNRRLTGVFDSTYIENYGWPFAPRFDKENQPAHVRRYETLAELAEGEGIVDPERFVEEVERFNGFCDDGVDRDFHRGEGAYDSPGIINSIGSLTSIPVINQAEPDLKNPMLGRVEKAPFYAVTYGLGSYSTCGGLKVDNCNRVTRSGEPISNLYAVGANAAFNYSTGGMGVAWGCWGAINAMNDIYGLGLF